MSRCNNSISLGTLLRVGAAFVVFALLLIAQTTTAQPAPTINYQGKLLDSASVTVPDGEYNMRFYLYNTTGGATTTAIWDEERVGGDQVTVDNGLFSVMLGAVDSLSGVDFNQTLYLGVEIGGTGSPGWDGEMAPRKILGSVPAAFEAGNATTFNNLATTSFLRSDQDDTASGLLTFTGGFISSASSTINRLTTGTTTVTTLDIGGEEITSLTGTGLTNTSGTLTVATSTLGLGDGSFLGLSDTQSSFTANRLLFTNGAGDAVTDSAGLTYDGTQLSLGGTGLSLTGSTANVTLGSNWLSGDGDDEGVFVSSTGSVGIGTSSPSSKLDVWGDFRVGTSSTPTFFADSASARVGIGTSNPQQALDVNGNIRLDDGITFTGGGSGNNVIIPNDSYLRFGASGASDTHVLVVGDGFGSGGRVNFRYGLAGLRFDAVDGSNRTERAILTNDGDFGIGTTAPSSKLDVNGTVNATAFSIGGTAITATAAELNYVDGVTSAIQTQIDAKSPLASPTFTGTLETAALNVTGTATSSVFDGNVTIAGNLQVDGGVSGAGATALIAAAVAAALAAAAAATLTFTNKRIIKRTSTTTSTTTLTPSPANYDVYTLTAQAAALTIANPTGTINIGDTIAIYVYTAAAQQLTFGNYYEAYGAALPTTTTAGKKMLITLQADTATTLSVLSAVQQ